MPRDAQFAIAEIGMNSPGEIRPLTTMVRPHAAIVTTVEPVHLEFFPSVAAIADAKADFGGIEPGGTAIVNIDNPQAARLAAHALASSAGRIVSFGASEKADIRLRSLDEDEGGSQACIDVFGRRLSCRIGMPGGHIAMNMLGVLAGVHAPISPSISAPWRQGRHRVDHHDVERAGADQHVGDLQRAAPRCRVGRPAGRRCPRRALSRSRGPAHARRR